MSHVGIICIYGQNKMPEELQFLIIKFGENTAQLYLEEAIVGNVSTIRLKMNQSYPGSE